MGNYKNILLRHERFYGFQREKKTHKKSKTKQKVTEIVPYKKKSSQRPYRNDGDSIPRSFQKP